MRPVQARYRAYEFNICSAARGLDDSSSMRQWPLFFFSCFLYEVELGGVECSPISFRNVFGV